MAEIITRFGLCSYFTYWMPSKLLSDGYLLFTLYHIGYTSSWIFASDSNFFNGQILKENLISTGSTVFQPTSSLPDSSELRFNIYMNNYIPLQALLIMLRVQGMGACSTVRVNTSAVPLAVPNDKNHIHWNKVSGGRADATGKVLAVQS